MWHFMLVEQTFQILLVSSAGQGLLGRKGKSTLGLDFLWTRIAVPFSMEEIQCNKLTTSVLLVSSSDRTTSAAAYYISLRC